MAPVATKTSQQRICSECRLDLHNSRAADLVVVTDIQAVFTSFDPG